MRRIQIYIFFGLFLFLVLDGCVPVQYEYYEPVAEGGKLSKSYPAIIAAKDRIEFIFNDIKIWIEGGSTGFYLVVSVPKGGSVRFVSNEIEWYLSPSQNKIKTIFNLAFYDLKTNHNVQVKPTDKMVHSSGRELSSLGSKYGFYENFIKLSEIERDRYFIKLPAIETNGHVFEIPVVEFIKKEGFGIFSING